MVLFAACDLDAAVQAERVSQRHLPRSGGRSEGQEGVEVAWQRPRSELSLRQFRLGRGALVLLRVDAGRRELPHRGRGATGGGAAVLHPAVDLLLVPRLLRATGQLRSEPGAGSGGRAARSRPVAAVAAERPGAGCDGRARPLRRQRAPTGDPAIRRRALQLVRAPLTPALLELTG